MQALIDFEVNVSNVGYLCKQMGIESSHQPRPATKTAANYNAVLLEIAETLEIVVDALTVEDLFSGDPNVAREKIRQIKKALS